MLRDALAAIPEIEVCTFSWRRALFGRYDVFHVHWPEILVGGQSPSKALVRQVLTALLLAKLRLTRTPLVKTMHNLNLPEDLSAVQRYLLRVLDRQTAMRIRLNHSTEILADQPHVTILHGHYRDWFSPYPRSARVNGRLAFFGIVRRYKGVEVLLHAFQGVSGSASLHIGGRPSSVELAEKITALARDDSRVKLRLEFLSDEELVTLVSEAELVVLPYREMHNSGSALTALSLGCPVLMPRNVVNDLLGEEVGDQWVFSYEGEITARIISETMAKVTQRPITATPDLSRRDWSTAGTEHVAAYRTAVRLLRDRSRKP